MNNYPNPKKRMLLMAHADATGVPATAAAAVQPSQHVHLPAPAVPAAPHRAHYGSSGTASAGVPQAGEPAANPRRRPLHHSSSDTPDDDDDDSPDDDDDDSPDDEDDDGTSGGATSDTTTDSEATPSKRKHRAADSKQKKRLRLDEDARRLDAALCGFGQDIQHPAATAAPARQPTAGHPQQFTLPSAHPHFAVPAGGGGVLASSGGGTLSADDSSDDSSVASFYSASSRGREPPPEAGAPEFAGTYSNKSIAMMRKMGFEADKGLGKQGQGRIAPIEASEQRGRRGLGLRLDGLDTAAASFDPTHEHIEMPEPAEWLRSPDDVDLADDLTRDQLDQWLDTCTPPKLTLHDERRFVEPAVLDEVLSSKSLFDHLGENDMRNARTRSNPFETIRGAIFLNRAAVKMANIDARFEQMFTEPRDEHGTPLVGDADLLYFADVCAGPGGFSEYVLHRRGWQAKGFGFTLRAEHDFKLHDFFAGAPETFNPFYGVKGDGNVFDPDNIASLVEHVRGETGDRGVHFMMADGGFSVEGQENIQEILSKQLYLCQCLVALGIVRHGGHFVCKLFDLFTPFSAGLVWLLWRCFREVCIFKPNTSRPANSERYLICKWKRPATDTVYAHLFDVNRTLWEQSKRAPGLPRLDVRRLVDDETLERSDGGRFFRYLCASNTRIGRNQIAGLLKIAAYCKDATLRESRQADIRSKCLEAWNIKGGTRRPPERKGTDKLLVELLGAWQTQRNFLVDQGQRLQATSRLGDIFRELEDWYFVAVDTVETSARQFRTMVMSKGGRDVLHQTASGSWLPLPEMTVELSAGTLLYAEVVREFQGEGRSQTVKHALHIIDAICLGGVDVRQKPLRERLRWCEKFALAMNKPNGRQEIQGRDGQVQGYLATIRCKKLYAMRDFGRFFERMRMRRLKDGNQRYGMDVRTGDDAASRFFVPRGLLFVNELRTCVQRKFSRTHNKEYYVDTFTKRTFYEEQMEDPSWKYASFKMTYPGRQMWTWEQADQVVERFADDQQRTSTKLLYRVDLAEFIDKRLAQANAR